MKNITCCTLQDLKNKNIDTTEIINEISQLMKTHYPNFYDWFNDKLIPGLDNNTRNIVLLYKKNVIIGFANLKKTEKENKLSNLYIKNSIFYDNYWKLIVDEAVTWLEDDYPVIIISNKEIKKCVYLTISRGWYFTDRTKNNDYVLNRYHEFESLRKKIKKKQMTI